MTLQQQEDEQSKLITTDDKTKLRQIVSPEVIISSDVIKYEPDGVVSRIVSVQHTIQPGGIAILSASQDIPNKVNYSEMINLKGVIFTLPEFALYMNGIQIWKKNQFENSSIETSSSSSSSSKQHQHPKWTSLCLQLDMESEERVAKFFIGAHFEEEVDVNIYNIPKDLKVVIFSSGAVKAYQALDVKRVGKSDKTQILWEI
ncbi:MAG: hypothetical protein EZS28_020887 [Streblomastix strix]|uniref:Uncharacterized protein n=1 Tax=Streblomastix strix TaxID=222440 RepID=A0A5J4VMB0_9EUKA|nr:MAG: hypothetical protein EZS28_020887 [Streblomastix strix]